MTTSVELSTSFVSNAEEFAKTESRTVAAQIEYWAKIGKMMIDNPDLNYAFVRESLQAKVEVDQGHVVPHVRRTNK